MPERRRLHLERRKMEGNGNKSCVKTLNKTQYIFQEIIFLHFWEKESPEWHLRCNMVTVKTRAFASASFLLSSKRLANASCLRRGLWCLLFTAQSPAVVKSEKNETAVACCQLRTIRIQHRVADMAKTIRTERSFFVAPEVRRSRCCRRVCFADMSLEDSQFLELVCVTCTNQKTG